MDRRQLREQQDYHLRWTCRHYYSKVRGIAQLFKLLTTKFDCHRTLKRAEHPLAEKMSIESVTDAKKLPVRLVC